MIRREVTWPDGRRRWLLVSQLEHARLSGVLAATCPEKFAAGHPATGSAELEAVRGEMLRAVAHHDDGWREWEEAPALDETGRPLTFTELPVEDSLAIWTGSVESAERLGALAPWTVAGHFSAILVASENHADCDAGWHWLREMTQRRHDWFHTWHAKNPSLHTAELAGEALRWVQLFDILSLWPCMSYPLPGEVDFQVPQPYRTAEDWQLVREILPQPNDPNRMVVIPWPFAAQSIKLAASAQLVPVARYASEAELLAACEPYAATWQLVPDRP